jgi:hypothetical protein
MHPTKIYLAAEERKEDSRRKKRDEEKEENVGLRETHIIELHDAKIAAGSRRRSWLGLADRPTICLFFFFRPWVSQPHLAVALPRHLAATHLATSRRPATETHGWVSPTVVWFFLGFGMIKSQKC